MSNPIFIEYYSHEGCDCYKTLNPWTDYNKETIVLCRIDEGLEKAKTLCIQVLHRKMKQALEEAV